MPSISSMPVVSFQSLRVAAGSAFARGYALAQARQVELRRLQRHCPVRRRRGEQDRDAVRGDRLQQRVRRRLLQQQRRGTRPQRKEQQAAQSEREGQRRTAGEDVVRRRAQNGPRPAIATRHHVAMEVHRALRLSRRPRRKSDERGVVERGGHVGEVRGLRGGARFEAVDCVRLELNDRRQCRTSRARGVEFRREPRVAQRMGDLRLDDDVGQFLCAQQRHGRHGDSACLHHREPARRHHRAVRSAQQHAVAGNKAHVLDQHARDAVGAGRQFRVGPATARPAPGSPCARPIRARPRDRAVPPRN